MKKFYSSTNKTSLFLVFILTAATLTAFFLSTSLSMTDAYAMKDIKKEKLECNNVNFNLNGLNIDAVPEPLSSLLQGQAETEGDQIETSNIDNGKYNHDKDFSFVCVNNNDNEFITPQAPQASQPPQTPPTEPQCEVTVTSITGVINPVIFAHDPVNERMYVANGGFQGTVSVIDTNTNTLFDTDGNATNGITPITIGGNPSDLAYDSVNKRVYVANDGSNSVSVIDTTTNTVIATIPIGFLTSSIAYDSFNGRMYVTDINSRVFVINTDTNTLIDIDGDDTDGITPILVGRAPIDIAYDSFNKRMYVVNFRSLDVSVIDTTTNTVTARIPVGLDPIGIESDPVNERMYVANSAFPDGNSTVSVIDTGNNTQIDTDGNATNGITRIIVGQDAGLLAYDPINKHMYVTNSQSDNVYVIDTTTNTVIDTLPVGSFPLGIEYDPVNHRMYVANRFDSNNIVSVIDLCPRPAI